ncbi:hypothetical protein D3C75_1222410 [compost metagenome]
MLLGQQRIHLLQVFETAEERQVVAGLALVLLGDQRNDRCQRGLTFVITGRDLAGDAHFELFGAKRRRHFKPGCIRWHAKQVAVEMPGAERG